MKRLIIFLIRKRLGLKKWQWFRFTNQKEKCWYYFEPECLVKVTKSVGVMKSNVSLNWLLDDECKVEVE